MGMIQTYVELHLLCCGMWVFCDRMYIVHPGVVRIAAEIANILVMTEDFLLLSLSSLDPIDLYSTQEVGFIPAAQASLKLVKRIR